MEYNKQKCSSIDHKEIGAKIFCQICEVYLCYKCENFHSKLFPNQNLLNKKNAVFIGLCQEKHHTNELEYYCKNHNKLCCSSCITIIKDEKNGQHKDCEISKLKDIKPIKEKKFKEDYNKLEEISKSLEPNIKQI